MLVLSALFVWFVSSAWDFPALAFSGEIIPKLPSAERLQHGMEGRSWYHLGKNFWTEMVRADAEWWSKLIRFLIWWSGFYRIVKYARNRSRYRGTPS